jgi:hypothetical protein
MHDKLVDLIEQELLSRNYNEIYKFVEYKNKKSGEIDIYARKNKYVFLFEIKSNYSKKSYFKAIEQLKRAEKYYFNKYDRVFKFFVYDIKNPQIRWII